MAAEEAEAEAVPTAAVIKEVLIRDPTVDHLGDMGVEGTLAEDFIVEDNMEVGKVAEELRSIRKDALVYTIFANICCNILGPQVTSSLDRIPKSALWKTGSSRMQKIHSVYRSSTWMPLSHFDQASAPEAFISTCTQTTLR